MAVMSVFVAGPHRAAAPVHLTSGETVPSIEPASVAVVIDPAQVRKPEVLMSLIDDLIACVKVDTVALHSLPA